MTLRRRPFVLSILRRIACCFEVGKRYDQSKLSSEMQLKILVMHMLLQSTHPRMLIQQVVCSPRAINAILICLLPIIVALLCAPDCFAGTSASQWVVVVNGDSENSRTIANHYSQLRNIPSRNIIVLRNVPQANTIKVEEFRNLILNPVLKEVDKRELSSHVQGIAYSTDIPTAIDLREDLKGLDNLPKVLTPTGSINGMTYLYRWAMQRDPSYIAPDSNWYAAHEAEVLLKINAPREVLDEITKLIDGNQHEEAAAKIDALRLPGTKNYPLDFLAAQQYALAGAHPRALARLEEAVRNGWKYRSEITDDPCFDSLRDDKDFKKIVAKCPNSPFTWLPGKSFNAQTYFTPSCIETTDPNQGVSYLMSMVLTYTNNDRMSMEEAIRHLERSAKADFTNPTGTFYFSKTPDVRSRTREPLFQIAIDELKKSKHSAEVITQPLPPNGSQVAGINFGVADFDWPRSGAVLLPGSLADNLTSLGGVMTSNAQTKATELLRNGAAAACGTVTEPYALQFKFPLPMLHAYYAQGLSAAEAFYSSLQSPYQLLILGDPICQPYAKPPRVKIAGCENGSVITEAIKLKLQPIESDSSSDPVQLTWMINGKTVLQSNFRPEVEIRLDNNDAGAQEWRFITKGPKPIENCWESSFWVYTGPPSTHLTLWAPEFCSRSESSKFRVKITQASESKNKLRIRHHWELLDAIPNDQGEFELDLSSLGSGPIRLQPVALDEKSNVLFEGPSIVTVVK